MTYTIHEAKINLSRLIKKAESGEEVVITRGKKPVAKITSIGKPKKRVPGRLKDVISWTSEAFVPLADDELRCWGLL